MTFRLTACLAFLFVCGSGPIARGQQVSEAELIEQLHSGDAIATASAARELGRRSEISDAAVAALLHVLDAQVSVPADPLYLGDPEAVVEQAVVAALEAVGDSSAPRLARIVAELYPTLWNGARARCLMILCWAGRSQPTITPEVRQLLSLESDVQLSLVVHTIGLVGEENDARLILLQELLSHDEPRIRLAALSCLGRMTEDAAPAAPDVIKLLNDPGEYVLSLIDTFETLTVRKTAIMVLARMGPSALPALPHLRSMMIQDKNLSVQVAAAYAISSLADEPKPIEHLVRLMGDPNIDIDVRRNAVVALTRLGSKAAPAWDDLVRIVNHGDDRLRVVAASALPAIDRERAWPVLISRSQDAEDNLRIAVLIALREHGYTASRDLLAAYLSALGEVDPDRASSERLRESAANGLRRLGPAAVAALPALENAATNDASKDVRAAARWAILGITPERN